MFFYWFLPNKEIQTVSTKLQQQVKIYLFYWFEPVHFSLFYWKTVNFYWSWEKCAVVSVDMQACAGDCAHGSLNISLLCSPFLQAIVPVFLSLFCKRLRLWFSQYLAPTLSLFCSLPSLFPSSPFISHLLTTHPDSLSRLPYSSSDYYFVFCKNPKWNTTPARIT